MWTMFSYTILKCPIRAEAVFIFLASFFSRLLFPSFMHDFKLFWARQISYYGITCYYFNQIIQYYNFNDQATRLNRNRFTSKLDLEHINVSLKKAFRRHICKLRWRLRLLDRLQVHRCRIGSICHAYFPKIVWIGIRNCKELIKIIHDK